MPTDSPPDEGPRAHCIVFTLKTPSPSRVADFVRRAAADGIVVNEDNGVQVAFMTDEKIVTVFGGRVTYRMPPSATSSGTKAREPRAHGHRDALRGRPRVDRDRPPDLRVDAAVPLGTRELRYA